MPKKFRNSLGDEFIITKGLGCLCVFPVDWRNALEEQLNKLGSPLELLLNPNIARLSRHFFWEMMTTTADSQFRVGLTPEHRRYAGIEDDLVICGCGNYVELWSPKALENYKRENDRVEDIVAAGNILLSAGGGSATGDRDAGVPSAGPA